MNSFFTKTSFFAALCVAALAGADVASLRADSPTQPIAGLDDAANPSEKVVSFTTSADQRELFRKRFLEFNDDATQTDVELTVRIDPAQTFQTIDGFGAAITGSTTFNLAQMSPEDREKFLVETFSPTRGLGFSFIRVSIGCSDFSLDEFTCCDEPGIENFALAQEDRDYVIPALKQILKINPKLKILASPWTCPRWMKVDNLTDLNPFESWTSGQLNPKFYDDYATYFVEYVRAMQAEGIQIDAITMQNEPLNRGNSASLFMTWQEQREFVKVLGPKFQNAGLTTEIIAFDHNFNYDSNKPECRDQFGYPLHLYEDAQAAQYLTGAAYHAYGGNKEEMKRVRDARPDKGLYFTEQSIGKWGYSFAGDLVWFVREIGIGTLNYDCKAVIVWNLMLDDRNGPFRPGGCSQCFGAVEISSDKYQTITRRSHYYEIGHFSKVFATGSKRIAANVETSKSANGFTCVAAQNPDGSLALVALNDSDAKRVFAVRCGERQFVAELPPKAVGSFHWTR